VITLIWSSDDLLAEEAAEKAAKAPEGTDVLSLDADRGIEGVDEAIFATSLFASNRMVVIRNAQALRKADVEYLSGLLHRDHVPSDVVVVATSDRQPSVLTNALKDVAKVERLQAPRRGDLVGWVTKRVKHHGLQPGHQAAPTLVETVGEGLRDLDQAIGQLATRAQKGAQITRSDVLQHFSRATEQPVWVLFDAIVGRQGPKAFDSLARLLDSGDSPLPILGALVSQVRGLIRAKGLLESSPGAKDSEIASSLGVSPGRAAVLRRQSGRLQWDWLLRVHRLLAEADFELKGGEDGAVLPGRMVMERVVAGALDA
jgi:DNA polymerase III subunit delta